MARARPRFTVKSAKKETKADPARERAWRAVRKFNQMTSTLTGFARALTGDQRVVVRAGSITSTDGRFINIVPPLALGDEISHERGMCNERRDDGQQLCPACNLGEKVMRRIYHEMAHITGKTMEQPSSGVRKVLYDLVDEWHPAAACSHGRIIKENINNSGSYIAAMRAIHPYAEMVIASLEDARIDGRMLRVRPGLRKSFYAATYDTFVNGVETKTGDLKYWREAPMTAQVIIGFTLKGANYLIDDDWLAPEVQDILEVPELRELVMAATAGPDVHETALKTAEMFRLLHKMGLLDADKCEVPPPSLNNPGDEGEESDKSDESDPADGTGEDASSSDSSDGDADSDTGGDDPGQPEEESSDADGAAGTDGDPAGDGTPGDTASDGAFGDDFDNEDRAEGDDKSTDSGSDDSSSEEEAGGDADSSDDGESGDDGTEADGSGDSGSAESGGRSDGGAEAADTDGTDDSSEAGDTVEADAEVDAEADEDGDEILGSGGEPNDEAGDEGGDEGVDEDGDGYVEPVGQGVWDEEVPEAKTSDTYVEVDSGTLDEVQEALEMFHPHQSYEGADPELGIEESEVGDDEDRVTSTASKIVEQALTQSEYFDRASQEVGGVDVCQFPLPEMNWTDDPRNKAEQFMPDEAVIGKALMQGRIVFAANKRSKNETNLTSGKINARSLGKRAPFADERMFRQRQLPGKRDYVVAITVDCSGSTSMAYRMERIKRAVFAKAELLHRLGIKFYITGHTGWYSSALKGGRFSVYSDEFDADTEMTNLWILNIKGIDEAWNDETRKRLANLQPMAENYDGHTLEFHRKELERRTETDKILIYYTDGAMPAANYDEELTILTEEIDTCKKRGITLMAVGINTSSPEAYGFDTVRVDSDEDLDKVVSQLKRRLLG